MIERSIKPMGLVALAALAACGGSPTSNPPLVCNGHTELCSRSYNAVAYPGTHDSYSDTDEKFLAPDQTHPIAQQLADGIRVLHFEVHSYNGGIYVCHGLCELGRKYFSDEMKVVADFVQKNPSEVVTLLLERSDTQVTADDLGNAMQSAGLVPFMVEQQDGQAWPTLGQMISSGKRVVAFLDDTSGSSFDWLLPRWQWTWETPWDNTSIPDFGRCDADRGTQGNSIYVVDTYLEDLPIECAAHAAYVNYDPFLLDRLLYCKQSTSTPPNFVMVNYYEASDLFHVVDVLNGFADAPASIGDFPPPDFDGGLPDGGFATGC